MQYNSVLSLKHFADPGFSLLMRHVFVHRAAVDRVWPSGNELGRAWELTAAARAMRDLGFMEPGKRALISGGGLDLLAYLLTDYLDEVVLTARPQEEPLVIRQWRADRMKVLSGSETPEAKAFDVVLVSEELSQLGSMAATAKRMAELARALKPGGLLIVITEILDAEGKESGFEGKIFFTGEQVGKYIIAPTGLSPIDEPELKIDAATRAVAYSLEEAAGRGLRPTSVMLTRGDLAWTSLCLVLRDAPPQQSTCA